MGFSIHSACLQAVTPGLPPGAWLVTYQASSCAEVTPSAEGGSFWKLPHELSFCSPTLVSSWLSPYVPTALLQGAWLMTVFLTSATSSSHLQFLAYLCKV